MRLKEKNIQFDDTKSGMLNKNALVIAKVTTFDINSIIKKKTFRK